MSYYLQELFEQYQIGRDTSPSEKTLLLKKLEEFVGWEKPDFALIGGPAVEKVILFQKNYSLDFGRKVPNANSIMASIVPEQVEILQKVDSATFKFAMQNSFEPMECLFELRFNVELVKGDVRSILRKISILSMDKNGQPDLALISLNDVTQLSSARSVGFNVKHNQDSHNETIEDLKFQVAQILAPQPILLTTREIDILREVASGLTSQDISIKLNIAKSTVDTHRQNMIRKNDAQNITTVINRAKSVGLI